MDEGQNSPKLDYSPYSRPDGHPTGNLLYNHIQTLLYLTTYFKIDRVVTIFSIKKNSAISVYYSKCILGEAILWLLASLRWVSLMSSSFLTVLNAVMFFGTKNVHLKKKPIIYNPESY